MERLDNIKVLIVEDDVDMRRTLEELLITQRAYVACSGSATDGMAQLRTFKPDVIVSDIGLPGSDGYHFMRMVRVRDASDGGTTPAIALTGFVGVTDTTRALLSGFNVHLGKPLQPAELCAAIKRLATPRDRLAQLARERGE